MEKIYIKTVAKEIVTKGSISDGHSDIFSYDPGASEHARKLGNLFVVGHVQHETSDVAYMINLVAALAKREYYARPNIFPKDAFTNTLKKINEVVEDFFKNNGLTINIGVFAIANDQIIISKLGKFKIILARNNKNIDILNNVDLFEKEHVQEKEFSNIISGKLMSSDRILAFYPGQPISSREKYIKSYFLKLPEEEFVSKINSIRDDNEGFSCALLYLNLHTVKETTQVPKLEPQELIQANLAVEAKKEAKAKHAKVSKEKPSLAIKEIPEERVADLNQTPTATPAYVQEVPRIIPSEFSLGKRANALSSLFKKFRLINTSRLNFKNKVIVCSVGVALVIVLALSVKSFFNLDPDAQKFKTVLNNAENNLRLAKTKISQNDSAMARQLLLASLTEVHSYYSYDSHKTESEENKLYALLDTIDQVQEAAPVLVTQLAQDLGQGSILAAVNDLLYVYIPNTVKDKTVSGQLMTIQNGEAKDKFETTTIQPTKLFINGSMPILIDLPNHALAVLQDGKFKNVDFSSTTASLIDLTLYQDNLYLLSNNNIYKMSDAAKKLGKLTSWLDAKTALPADSLSIGIDGNVYVLSKSGTVTTYYKGAKKTEVKLPLAINDQSLFFVSLDGDNFYVIDKSMGRIYILNKTTGNLTKTYKISTSHPIVAATLASDDTIYFLTSDNKVWKIK